VAIVVHNPNKTETIVTVDMYAREEVALAMDNYLDCTIDNFALNKALLMGEKRDTACYELYLALVDTLYSIWYRHKNAGDAELTATQQGMFRRWIILLRSSEEWPLPSRFGALWPRRFCGELFGDLFAFVRSSFGSSSPLDNEYWPYESAGDWYKFERRLRFRG
jgi:hypothetical protein